MTGPTLEIESMIVLRKNGRGFLIGTFRDQDGEPCSIQESGAASRLCIWLGCEDVEGEPGRMHLSVDDVRDLLPLLERFVEQSDLHEPDEPCPICSSIGEIIDANGLGHTCPACGGDGVARIHSPV